MTVEEENELIRLANEREIRFVRERAALAAAASGGDVKQAPGEAPQSGGDSRNAQKPIP